MGKHSRLSNIFNNMKKRCYNINNNDCVNYGARGITVCEEWMDNTKACKGNCTKGFIAFKLWALSHGYSDNLTLDRINTDKAYSPSNCCWVSMRVQGNNRRDNFYITYKSKSQSLAD